MQPTLMAEWVREEREVKLIVMWQAQPELYEVISRIRRMLVVLAYMWLWPLPTICPSAFSPVFVAADDPTHNFFICYFF